MEEACDCCRGPNSNLQPLGATRSNGIARLTKRMESTRIVTAGPSSANDGTEQQQNQHPPGQELQPDEEEVPPVVLVGSSEWQQAVQNHHPNVHFHLGPQPAAPGLSQQEQELL